MSAPCQLSPISRVDYIGRGCSVTAQHTVAATFTTLILSSYCTRYANAQHRQGIIGLILNIGIFAALLAVETTSAKVNLTEGEQHWRKKIVSVSCCVFNLLLAGAGIGLAGAMGLRLSGRHGQLGMIESERTLIAPLVLCAVQA